MYFTEDANTEVTANDKLELFLKWIQACRNSEHNSKGTLANLTIVAFRHALSKIKNPGRLLCLQKL